MKKNLIRLITFGIGLIFSNLIPIIILSIVPKVFTLNQIGIYIILFNLLYIIMFIWYNFKTIRNELIRLIILFLGLIFFSSIPIILFGIDYDKFSMVQKALYMFGCDLVYLSIILWWNLDKLKKDIRNFTKDIFGNLETSFKYYILGFIAMVVSNLILIFITNGSIAGNEEAVRDMIDKVPLYMAFSTILYAPLTEELIFRKCLKDVISNKWLYILLSGFIFGGMHIIGSATNAVDVLFIIPYSSLGLAFAYTYYKTDNIFNTISMHLIHNTFAYVLYLVAYGLII